MHYHRKKLFADFLEPTIQKVNKKRNLFKATYIDILLLIKRGASVPIFRILIMYNIPDTADNFLFHFQPFDIF